MKRRKDTQKTAICTQFSLTSKHQFGFHSVSNDCKKICQIFQNLSSLFLVK